MSAWSGFQTVWHAADILGRFFFKKKDNFGKKSRRQNSMKNHPVCNELKYRPMHYCITTKTKWSILPAKTLIRLGMCPVWSESLICLWRNSESFSTKLFWHTDVIREKYSFKHLQATKIQENYPACKVLKAMAQNLLIYLHPLTTVFFLTTNRLTSSFRKCSLLLESSETVPSCLTL